MKNKYTNILRKYMPRLFAFAKGVKLLYWQDSYLVTTGYMKSMGLGRPCNQTGEPVPWMNYNVISFLEQRLNRQMTLFEYGSGYSTQYYAKHVLEVTSVEHDREWYDKIKNELPDNTKLIFQELDYNGDYCRAISHTQRNYDVAVVDGRDRVRCTVNAVAALSERGVVILDDAHREKYSEAVARMASLGFKELSFEGLKPNNYALHKTTIFYRENNCLSL